MKVIIVTLHQTFVPQSPFHKAIMMIKIIIILQIIMEIIAITKGKEIVVRGGIVIIREMVIMNGVVEVIIIIMNVTVTAMAADCHTSDVSQDGLRIPTIPLWNIEICVWR